MAVKTKSQCLLPLSLSKFLRGSLSLNLELAAWLDGVTSEPHVSFLSPPPSVGITGMYHHISLFTWALGVQMPSSCLYNKDTTH